jgi:hypothetical protein
VTPLIIKWHFIREKIDFLYRNNSRYDSQKHLPLIAFLIEHSFSYVTTPVPKVSSGKIVRIRTFSSKLISRNIDIWLPEGYSNQKKYAVLYMHDGQMLFDSTTTWNKQDWQADEVAIS